MVSNADLYSIYRFCPSGAEIRFRKRKNGCVSAVIYAGGVRVLSTLLGKEINGRFMPISEMKDRGIEP